MKRSHIPPLLDRKWLAPLLITSALSLLLFLSLSLLNARFPPPPAPGFSGRRPPHSLLLPGGGGGGSSSGLPRLPRLAYLITGTKDDGARAKRLLQAVYHPRNYYLIHLDLEAPESERLELARYVKSEGVAREFGNVMVIGDADLVTSKGPTMIASTLHAIAVLLKRAEDWDWFINLSASDYPLLPQDGWFVVFPLCEPMNFTEISCSF